MIKLAELLDEKHLTPAEIAKKEDILKAMKKSGTKLTPREYAIATAKAEKIAENEDHEASMAKSELRDMITHAAQLYKMIEPGDELPGWVSAYITLAADYIHSVQEYMTEKSAEMNEAADQKKTLKVREIIKLIQLAPEEDIAALESIAKNYYNYPWYWEMSDARNTEQKAERKNAILKKLVNSLQSEEAEDIAVDIHNIYAPDDRRITSVNQIG